MNVETIRYYEKRGLVPEPDRSASGRRLFSKRLIAELRFVRRCREMGFAINDIEEILLAARSGEQECREVSKVGRRQLASVREKIETLKELEASLSALLDQCCEDGRCSCPMLDCMLRDPLT